MEAETRAARDQAVQWLQRLVAAIENGIPPQTLTVAIHAREADVARLMRLFNEQLEAMAKLKGKTGQQRVVVEHVTVHQGGQAIVGAVSATKAVESGGGGGTAIMCE